MSEIFEDMAGGGGVVMMLAQKNYDKETYAHVLRVAHFVEDNELIPDHLKSFCIKLAICHDLIEDTDVSLGLFTGDFQLALDAITKPEKETYKSYIKHIKELDMGEEWCQAVYWVKIADMKDHLSQKETLTERLKEKYLEGLAILL